MSDYVHLVGAEQVQSAANRMLDAAANMQSAAHQIEAALDRHARAMEEFVGRIDALAERLTTADVTPSHDIPRPEAIND